MPPSIPRFSWSSAPRRHFIFVAILAFVVVAPAVYLLAVTRELRTVQSALGRQQAEQAQALKIIREREVRRDELPEVAERTLGNESGSPAAEPDVIASAGGSGMVDARVMSDPDYQARLRLQIRGEAQAAFAPLFQKLQLTEEARNRLSDLIAERKMTTLDAQDLARQAGVSARKTAGRSEVSQLMKKLLVPFDEEIRTVTGADGFEEYLHYNQTLSLRATVGSLAEHLAATEPLRAEQREQLVAVLAEGRRKTSASASVDPAQLVESARGFLSAGQLLAFRQLQDHEETQRAISTFMLAQTPR